MTKPSEMAVRQAVEVAQTHDSNLTVLHVNLYQSKRRVRRSQLKREVESKLGRLPRTQYIVTPGVLVEEAVRDEAVAENADFVVLEGKRAGYLQRMNRHLFATPDVEQFLRRHLDCQIITASAP